MTEVDQYAEWDASYVLGALSVAERSEYEAHLAGCGHCRTAVSELAGLPGLLGQLSPGEAIAVESTSGDLLSVSDEMAEPFPAPEPTSFMPRLPRDSALRRWLAPVAAAAAALLIGGVGGYVASASRGAVPGDAPTSTVALSRSRLAFAPVKESLMTAVVDVVPTGEGTELRVECQYAPRPATTAQTGSAGSTSMPPRTTSPGATTTALRSGDGAYPGIRYAIWVVGRDGRQMLVKDWTARSGRIMHPSGVTPWPVSQIAAVEIRLADTDDPVMRARLS